MKFKLYLFISIMALSVMSSCRKESFEGDPTGENGTTYIRLRNATDTAPLNEIYFTPFTDVKSVELLDLRRDASSGASLNTTVKVALTFDDAAIPAGFDALPDNIYTLDAPGFTKTATGYDVTFAPGEFSKTLMIKLDGSKYDLSKKYAMPFKIGAISGDAKLTTIAKEKTIVTTIAIKNKYDGVYEIASGTLEDLAVPTITHINNFLAASGDDNMQYELRTISATKCLAYDNYFFGGLYYPISSAATYSRYGGVVLIVEFDPATDKVVGVSNYYSVTDAVNNANKRDFVLDPSGDNNWDNGTMKIKYQMMQNGAVRANISEEWKYLGER